MNLKRNVILISIVALLFGNIMVTSAEANKAQYGYDYVTKTGDLISGLLTKQNSSEDASNLVGSVQGGRTLCSWVTNALSSRLTNKVSYNSGDPVYMQYNEEGAGAQMQLVVSTVLTNFEKTGTFGYWSPDYITTY